MEQIKKLKEKRKLYSAMLKSAQRPDRIKVIINSIDEDIKRAEEAVV